jgi:hypothetical protein
LSFDFVFDFEFEFESIRLSQQRQIALEKLDRPVDKLNFHPINQYLWIHIHPSQSSIPAIGRVIG